MFKILLALLLAFSSCEQVWATQWRAGTGEQSILGSSNAALIGYNSYNSIVQPLDNLLSNHCNEYLQYNSSSIITVVAGTCAVSNSQGTIRLFMMDTANTNLTSANLDTGSITANTTYYVYATAASTSTTTSTYYISASNTAPSGQTYYYQIGSFKTDASSQFTTLQTNAVISGYVGAYSTKSMNVIYQALTDGIVEATASSSINAAATFKILSDSSSTPTTVVAYMITTSTTSQFTNTMTAIVRKGDYYEVIATGAQYNNVVYFVPLGK